MAVAPLVVTLPRTAALAAPLVEVGVTTTLAIEIETEIVICVTIVTVTPAAPAPVNATQLPLHLCLLLMAVVVLAALLDDMMLTLPLLLFLLRLPRPTMGDMIPTAAKEHEDAPVPRHLALITTTEIETETVIGTACMLTTIEVVPFLLPTLPHPKATMTTPATETVIVTGEEEDEEIEIATGVTLLPRSHQDLVLAQEEEEAAAA